MQTILSKYTASISELKRSPSQVIQDAGDKVIAILNHNTPSAYLVPISVYENMLKAIESYNALKERNESNAAKKHKLRI